MQPDEGHREPPESAEVREEAPRAVSGGLESEGPEAGLRTPSPLLVVISGPSGVGKDAILARMKQMNRPYHFVVTATTRPPRPREIEGSDYFFVSRAEFERMVANDELLEWATVYGNYYGVPKEQVRKALARGRDVVVKPDVQGAATIKRLVPDAVFIFIAPPSLAELDRRLRQRRTESPAEMAVRIRTAQREMACLSTFDYVVINRDGGLGDTVAQVEAIIQAEKCRVRARQVRL